MWLLHPCPLASSADPAYIDKTLNQHMTTNLKVIRNVVFSDLFFNFNLWNEENKTKKGVWILKISILQKGLLQISTFCSTFAPLLSCVIVIQSLKIWLVCTWIQKSSPEMFKGKFLNLHSSDSLVTICWI